MQAISIRNLTEADLPRADELRQAAGWNQLPGDWQRFLDLEPQGCFVALTDGTVVGSVTTITYGQALAWIGMMLVHPDYRRQGIGRRLMTKALEYLHGRGVKCIKLDATPAGLPLYEQLGFVSEWSLTRWQRPEASTSPQELPVAVRELRDTDWNAVDDLDTTAFGTPRPQLIRSLANGSLKAIVFPESGPVQGWGLLRPGAKADYIGPVACANTEALASLVQALVQKAGTRSIFWDIPDLNKAATHWAQALGFTPVRPLRRMRSGPDAVPSNPHAQFAIADPAVG